MTDASRWYTADPKNENVVVNFSSFTIPLVSARLLEKIRKGVSEEIGREIYIEEMLNMSLGMFLGLNYESISRITELFRALEAYSPANENEAPTTEAATAAKKED